MPDLDHFRCLSDCSFTGTHDFFGLNHYTSRLVEPVNESTQNMRVHPDFDLVALPDPQWDRAGT